MKIIITEEQKKKLFVPLDIEKRKIEAEKLKQKYISEIKEIIEEEGPINMGELEGESIVYEYGYENYDPVLDEDNTDVSLIERFYSNNVEVVVYGGYKYGSEVHTFDVPYEQLDLEQVMKIRELLETYDAH